MKKIALIFWSILILLGSWYFFIRQDQYRSFSRKGCYARIPIQFVGHDALIEIEIGEKKYPVQLDLGASCQFAFFNEIINNISEKKIVEPDIFTDIKGNQYKENGYSIPLIKSRNLTCTNAIVYEEPKDFAMKGAILWGENKKESEVPYIGRVGRGCFLSNNLFLDFPNSMLFVTSNIDQLKIDHWQVGELFEVPFEISKWGITLSIETDIGMKRFILDTGSNVTLLKSSILKDHLGKEVTPGRKAFTTQKFVIGAHDFGPLDLSAFEFSSSIDADGFLGIDFLQNYAIYFNFKNNKAFIGPSSKVCGAIIF